MNLPWDDPLVSRGDKITVVSSRANLKITINYNIDFDDGLSQLTRYFVTKMVDSDGLKWTQLDRAGLGFGHNLGTVWSFFVVYWGERYANDKSLNIEVV